MRQEVSLSKMKIGAADTADAHGQEDFMGSRRWIRTIA
jgi:hypothetical protein